MIIQNKTFFSLSTQTGILGYNFDLYASNTTGYAEIGFSGSGDIDSPVFNFILHSGRIYDYENKYIYGYRTNESLNIKGNTSGNKNTYFINNVPVSLNSSRNTGYIEYFYIDPIGCSVSMDASISGHIPNYSISNVNFINQAATGTGYFINNSDIETFRIFTGESQSSDLSYLTNSKSKINPNESEFFTIVKNYEEITAEDVSDNTYQSPFTFYTNFGRFNTDLNITTTYTVFQDLATDIPMLFSGSGITYGYLNWYNYKGGARYLSSGLPIEVLITESGGDVTGNWNINTGTLDFNTLYSSFTYNSVISGYSGVLDSYGFSGISFQIMKLNTGSLNLTFNINGYNENIENNLTGV